MAEIQVNLLHMATNIRKRVSLADNVSVGSLIPKMVNAMGGDPASAATTHLMNKSQGFDYNAGDTLGGRGTQPDDTLGLVQEFQAGLHG